MPILLDYSQLAISCAVVFEDDMKKGKDTKKMQDIIRHVTLKSLATYLRDYRKYGQLILCCDTPPLWRKKVFKYYKKHRAKDREESTLDWDTILQFVSELQHDLETVFPYPVVKAVGAEGDDCIGVLAEYFSTREDETESENPLDALTGDPPVVLILSSDHDYKQCLKRKNIKQWSIIQKKWVLNTDPDFLFNKIVAGDKGDGVPSVLMEDDWFVNGEGRAKSVTKAVYEKFKDYDALDDEEKRRFERNKDMIDFSRIPIQVKDSIIESYTSWKKTTKKQDIMNYLIKHRCRELLDRIGDF